MKKQSAEIEDEYKHFDDTKKYLYTEEMLQMDTNKRLKDTLLFNVLSYMSP